MSTHKHFDKICCVVIVLTLILTILFMNATSFGVRKESNIMGYEDKLFDTSTVHTLNIMIDDWDTFLDNCQSEEYYNCTVVIDDETYRNVAIRGKGNTSLSQVPSYGNDRYSFKIEFDHYDNANTYYGLDKLCLNNIIQDNTYMKDYLTYQMMAEMGVASPLCSYIYITVNEEDWGLYLAVEGVEDSFLKRNFGTNYGELYKPDSMNMGGGRGNGKQFDMDDFMEDFDFENMDIPQFDMENFMKDFDFGNIDFSQFENQMPMTSNMPNENEKNQNNNMQGWQIPNNFNGTMPNDTQEMPPEFPNEESENENTDKSLSNNKQDRTMPNFSMPFGKNDDVLLKYIDDETDSYSNIFNNAKTNISNSDKTRLINALKNLTENKNLSDTVDIETVIRYFVVHNFVVNFDSYTGSMIHNYYLYEKDGQLQMIPWDYNLAFGGFQSMGGATSLVNYPIDSPVSGGNTEDRPMIAWIFANQEYTDLYHTIFEEFISEYFNSGYFETMFDSVTEMIAPYVEKDPTKFCTYEEFEKGIATLKSFCMLRAESINGQLEGSIGATTDTQDSNTFVNAEDLQISDMGSMGNFMGGKRNSRDENMTQMPNNKNNNRPQMQNNKDNDISQIPNNRNENASQMPNNRNENVPQTPNNGNNDTSQMPNNRDTNRPQMQNNKQSFSNNRPEMNMDKNSNNQTPQNFGGNRENSEMPLGFDSTTLKLLTVYIGILIGGLVIVTCFTRRRKK